MVGSRKTEQTGVRAVLRAVAIMRAFTQQDQQRSLSELASAAKLDKGTTRRLLLTLKEAGLVLQNPATQRYSLSLAVVELGAAVPEGRDLRAAARPVLSRLARDIGCTAFLSVYRDRSAICLERLHDGRSVEVHTWTVGGVLPLNCGGAPKLLLALQSDAEIRAVLKPDPVRLTPGSIVQREKLLKRLDRIRRQGWECATDDVVVGLTALATPVFSPTGELVAAISASSLNQHMLGPGGRPRHLDIMQAAAKQITGALRS